MASTKEIVVSLLDERKGDVRAVAEALGLSESYVRRVARGEGVQTARYLPMGDETWVTRRGVHAWMRLRRAVVRELTRRVEGGDVDVDDLVKLVTVLLQHDAQLRARPVVSVDARQQSMAVVLSSVADYLSQYMGLDDLRRVAYGEHAGDSTAGSEGGVSAA